MYPLLGVELTLSCNNTWNSTPSKHLARFQAIDALHDVMVYVLLRSVVQYYDRIDKTVLADVLRERGLYYLSFSPVLHRQPDGVDGVVRAEPNVKHCLRCGHQAMLFQDIQCAIDSGPVLCDVRNEGSMISD